MTTPLKRSTTFQIELHTLVRKLRAQTLDSEERERVAEILLNNTTDVFPDPTVEPFNDQPTMVATR